MIMFLGYAYNSGTFDSDSGGKINWSNFLIRGVSNEGLQSGEVGLVPFEQKFKGSILCSHFNLHTDDEVKAALNGMLGSRIQWSFGIVKGKVEATGFTALSSPGDTESELKKSLK